MSPNEGHSEGGMGPKSSLWAIACPEAAVGVLVMTQLEPVDGSRSEGSMYHPVCFPDLEAPRYCVLAQGGTHGHQGSFSSPATPPAQLSQLQPTPSHNYSRNLRAASGRSLEADSAQRKGPALRLRGTQAALSTSSQAGLLTRTPDRRHPKRPGAQCPVEAVTGAAGPKT